MDGTPVNFTFTVSLAVQSTPTAKKNVYIAFFDARNTISPYLRHLIMLAFLLYEKWNNNFIFTCTNYSTKLAQEKGGVQINRVYKLLEIPRSSQIALESMSLPIPIVLVYIWLRFVLHFHTSGLN